MGQSLSAMIGRTPTAADVATREHEEAPPAVLTRRPPAPADDDAAMLDLLSDVPDPGLVITEAAMCAYCFESIVGHFNGAASSAAPPSFDNGSQCDRERDPPRLAWARASHHDAERRGWLT